MNEFSEVSNQMAELQRQKEDLRERIFAFAEQMGTALIQGSGVRASISTREQTNFPGKREALRKELVTFLKQSGRWDEVSDFDATQLSEILDNESWPPELLEELRKFAHTEVSTTLRLSRTQGKTPEER